MKIIEEKDVTLDKLLTLFAERQMDAEIVDVLPAAPEWAVDRDAYIHVTSTNGSVVTVYLDTQHPHLRLRMITLTSQERSKINSFELVKEAAMYNQQLDYFGAISPGGLLGATIEYRLPYTTGILDQTIVSAVNEMAKWGAPLRSHLLSMIEE